LSFNEQITLFLLFKGNANLIYTIIRKRQVFFTLSSLSTDAPSIAKLTAKNTTNSPKKSLDNSSSKQMIFENSSKVDDEPKLNQDPTQQITSNTPGMVTSLPEMPCKYILFTFFFQSLSLLLAIHKMTERTLAASASIDVNQQTRTDTTNSNTPSSTRVKKIKS